MSVRTTVKSIQDIMRQDVGVDGDAQRLSQLCWMFFLKIIDDQDVELELLNLDYHAPILSLLRAGEVTIDWTTRITIKNGIVKFDQNECMVLVDE